MTLSHSSAKRGRTRQTETDRHRQTQTETDRQTQTERHTETDRDRHRQTDNIDRQTEIDRDRPRQTDRDRQTEGDSQISEAIAHHNVYGSRLSRHEARSDWLTTGGEPEVPTVDRQVELMGNRDTFCRTRLFMKLRQQNLCDMRVCLRAGTGVCVCRYVCVSVCVCVCWSVCLCKCMNLCVSKCA